MFSILLILIFSKLLFLFIVTSLDPNHVSSIIIYPLSPKIFVRLPIFLEKDAPTLATKLLSKCISQYGLYQHPVEHISLVLLLTSNLSNFDFRAAIKLLKDVV